MIEWLTVKENLVGVCVVLFFVSALVTVAIMNLWNKYIGRKDD